MKGAKRLDAALVWRVTATAAMGMVLAMVGLVWMLAAHLKQTADADLNAATRLVTSFDDEQVRRVDEQRLRSILPGSTLVAVVDAQGEVRALSSAALDVGRLPVDHVAGETFGFDASGRHYRGQVVANPRVEVTSADGTVTPLARILIAIDVSSNRTTLRKVTGFALGGSLAAMAAVALVTRTVVRRSLKPLSAMASAAGRIAQTGQPEPMPRTPYRETETLGRAVDDAMERRLAAEQAVRDFVADASHELRTPIAKVQGWTDLLVEGSLDADRTQGAIDAISAATEELATMVHQLALLARLDAPETTPEVEVDLAALANEVADEARQVAAGADVAVSTSGAVIVRGDAAQLRTALRNLVGNAVQHGGAIVSIDIAGDDAGVTIAVRDNGPGIPAQLRARVFNRFFTTAPGHSQHSGLGLAIVEAVARRHGGRVTVGDAKGGGALVTMRLTHIESKP